MISIEKHFRKATLGVGLRFSTAPTISFDYAMRALASSKAGSVHFPLPGGDPIDRRYLVKTGDEYTKPNRLQMELDRYFVKNGILIEDIPRNLISNGRQFTDVSQLRYELYGDNPFPILREEVKNSIESQSPNVDLRRQLMIEKAVVSSGLIEFRLFTEGMLKRGQLAHLSDNSAKTLWSSWLIALTDRVKAELRLDQPALRAANYRYSATVKRAPQLLLKSKLAPDSIAAITLVTSLSEICSAESSTKSTITGRGNSDGDYDVLSAGVRTWTNTDLESSIEGSTAMVGKALFTQLCDTVGSAIQFEMNSKSGNSPTLWSQEDRVIVGAELVRWMIGECMMKMHESVAMRELAFNTTNRGTGSRFNDKWVIDPEAEMLSFLRNRSDPKPDIASTGPAHPPVVLVNAFKHSVEHRGFKSSGYVSLRPALVNMFSRLVPHTSFFRLPPMTIKPLPWSGYWLCGYVSRRFPLIRFTGTRDGSRDGILSDTSRIRKCMDYLGSTRWEVSKPVLAAVEAGLLVKDRQIPGLPQLGGSKGLSKARKQGPDGKIEKRTELMRRLREKQKLDNEEPILLSKLDVARQFKDADSIYFPHSIDFRGRAYPIPAPFNHQGDDVARGLLRFADKKRLGERGWFWLKIHIANLLGKDKLTFADRVAWVDKNMDAIVAVAKDPLSQQSIKFVSSQTEDFWQTVAACIEISDAVSSGEPTEFESGLPVQQDGSCNGLQHYAALGRDELGALAVNVKPSDRVEDVYTVVLNIVKDRVKDDTEKFSEYKNMEAAELFKVCPTTFDKLKTGDVDRQRAILANIALRSEGVLARKTVKQTVMTICYGVTQIGASDQVAKQLNDLPLVKNLSAAQMAVLSGYLARLTLSSIDTVFCKAMEIKRWFDKVSAEVNKHRLPVCWISPAGVPCRQPYRKQTLTSIRTPMQKITLSNEINYDNAPVSAAKQRMGFPPNFIHSLDASHMILTALECKKAGIAFASVHDSFWTHAADVDTMNQVIRQEFHKMYEQPILERLRNSLVFSLGVDGKNIPPLPQQGDLDLKCVLESPYFFD